jgi:poly(3-hydroxybutyrate) depolymerase
MKAVDQACVLFQADRERVAVAGLSAGASMAALLATRYPQRFKALVMHSGVPPGAATSSASALSAMQGRREPLPAAASREWPPLMVIHGDADRVVSARNAGSAALMWSEAAGAQPQAPQQQRRGKRYPMRVTQFKRARDVVATLVEVDKLGHAWSGGAARQRFSDANGPDASRMVWRFVSRQFEPG